MLNETHKEEFIHDSLKLLWINNSNDKLQEETRAFALVLLIR